MPKTSRQKVLPIGLIGKRFLINDLQWALNGVLSGRPGSHGVRDPGGRHGKCVEVLAFNRSFSFLAHIRLLRLKAARSRIDDGIPKSRKARDLRHPG